MCPSEFLDGLAYRHFEDLGPQMWIWWCRRKLVELKQIISILYREYVSIDSEAWNTFELQQLRKSSWVMSLSVAGLMTMRLMGQVKGELIVPAPVLLIANMVVALGLFLLYSIARKQEDDSKLQHLLLVAYNGICITVHLVIALSGCLAQDTILAHRMFCSMFPFAWVGMASGYAYLPVTWNILLVPVQGALIWKLFNWTMEFETQSLLIIVCAVLQLVSSVITQRASWHAFCSVEQERRMRSLSESLSSTLRGVLDKMVDASCECDESGRICSASPQMQLILGRSAATLVGVDLAALAADSVEAQRVDTFLQQILVQRQGASLHDVSPLALLETAFGCEDLQVENEASKLNVKISCVAVPVESTVGLTSDNPCAQRLYVGLQEIKPLHTPLLCSQCSASLQDPPEGPLSPRASERDDVHHSPSEEAEHLRKAEFLLTAERLVDRQEEEADPPCQSTDLGVGQDTRGQDHMDSMRRRAASGESAESEISYAISASTHVSAEVSSSSHSSRDSATQTEAQHQALSSISELEDEVKGIHCKGVQTEQAVCTRRPPKADGSHTDLKTRKCFQRKFKPTAKDTMEQMILQVMVRMNPKGKGCCYVHIALATLHKVVSEMSARRCLEAVKPNSSWQCGHCKAVFSEDDGDDEECPVCGRERSPSSSSEDLVEVAERTL